MVSNSSAYYNLVISYDSSVLSRPLSSPLSLSEFNTFGGYWQGKKKKKKSHEKGVKEP